MSFGDRVIRQITMQPDDRRLPPSEPNPLQKAYDDYNDMKREYTQAKHEANELRVSNQALVAEVNMLREMVERCDGDRVRLQNVASTLTGQLMAINSVIGDAMRMAIKNGIRAVDEKEEAELAQAGEEASEIMGRVERTPLPDVRP